MHVLDPDVPLWLQFDSPRVLKRLNVVYVTVVSRGTTVILYISFMYQLEDIYRSWSLDKFSAVVGKSSVSLNLRKEWRIQTTSNFQEKNISTTK